MNETNAEIRTIQSTEMGIVKQVVALCRQHGLTYYMLGGTLLGAVRHKGFIPWDDDIDVGLPRPDYDRFLEIARHELQTPFAVEEYTPGVRSHQQYFAKVTDSRVKVRLVETDSKSEVPVWVDVFPLDGVPEGSLRFWWWKNRGLLLAKLFTLAQTKYEYDRSAPIAPSMKKVEKGIRLALKLRLDCLLSCDRLWRKLDRHLRKYDFAQSKRLINFCGHWHMKEMFPKTVYGDGADYPFEDIVLRGPADADFVLRQMYGDYMTPPPEDKRNLHGTELAR